MTLPNETIRDYEVRADELAHVIMIVENMSGELAVRKLKNRMEKYRNKIKEAQ